MAHEEQVPSLFRNTPHFILKRPKERLQRDRVPSKQEQEEHYRRVRQIKSSYKELTHTTCRAVALCDCSPSAACFIYLHMTADISFSRMFIFRNSNSLSFKHQQLAPTAYLFLSMLTLCLSFVS